MSENITTIQQIVETIKSANFLPVKQVNYGITDGLKPPFICVKDYKAAYQYQTPCGISLRNSVFTVLVVHKTLHLAEDLAFRIDALLNLSQTVTTDTDRCFQEEYEVGQLELNSTDGLYQFGAMLSYSLVENYTPYPIPSSSSSSSSSI